MACDAGDELGARGENIRTQRMKLQSLAENALVSQAICFTRR
jgi:hypothetical protein